MPDHTRKHTQTPNTQSPDPRLPSLPRSGGARQRAVIVWQRLRSGWRIVWRYARPPETLPAFSGRGARIGQGVVALCALAFAVFFSAYLFGQHDAFHTNAEDMGIMTQALWNTTHGAPLHQTICNIVSDSNCMGDVSRLAIHFEPIMFVVALLYALAPSPKTLQLIQVLVVALGAFPAYWIAARRLRSVAVGVLFALLYLLYPSLDSAVTSDFHAVTLAAPLLLFALYFLLTRKAAGFWIVCAVAVTTKEEVALTVAMLGLYAVVIQGRRRFGWTVVGLAAGWVVMEVAVMHALSPVGHSPLTSRYAAFGSSPLSMLWGVISQPLLVVHGYLLDTSRVAYLGMLLAPLAFLGLCSPALLLLAGPALGINILSSDPAMYSGYAQYNAEIVPIVIVATIDGAAKLSALGTRMLPPAAAWARMRGRTVFAHARAAAHIIVQCAALAASLALASREIAHLRASAGAVIERGRASIARGAQAAAGSKAARELGGRWVTLCSAVSRGSWPTGLLARWSSLQDTCAELYRSLASMVVRWRQRLTSRRFGRRIALGQAVLLALALLPVGMDLQMQQRLSFLPVGRSFAWPQTTAHMQLADSLIAQIPPSASVSAQTDLVSHLSNRRLIYMFPYDDLDSDYDLLDVTGNTYPLMDVDKYDAQVHQLLSSGRYQLVAATDGYLLLRHDPPPSSSAPPITSQPASGDMLALPPSFYSFTQAAPAAIPNKLHGVSFDAGDAIVRLVGYDVSPTPNLYLTNPYLTVTTYWRVTGKLDTALTPEVVVTYPSGYTQSTTSSVTTQWLPMNAWPQGQTMVVRSWPMSMPRQEAGAVRVGVRVRTLTDGAVDGALRLRPSHTITPGQLSAHDPSPDGGPQPVLQAQVGEAGTLVSFASERVVP